MVNCLGLCSGRFCDPGFVLIARQNDTQCVLKSGFARRGVVGVVRYLGNDRSMLIPNTLFRIGGAAIVLTNKPSWKSRSKYELQHVVRVHMGKDEKAYQ